MFNIFYKYKERKYSKKQKQDDLDQQISDASKKRILFEMKKVKSIIKYAQYKKFNEANTVKIVQDICVDLLGYHKHYEIEMEYLISGKRCDMAIFIKKNLKCLVEIKAIRIQNIDKYIEQAVQYGANSRTHCVVLTNARTWYFYWLNHENSPSVNGKCLFEFDILNDRASRIAKCFQILAKEHITQFIKNGIAQDKANLRIKGPPRPSKFMSVLINIGLGLMFIVIAIMLILLFLSMAVSCLFSL